VAVQTKGSQHPFFFLHGDYKNGGFYCFPLAHSLGPDQPFYALEPYKFDDLQSMPTLEDMASAHIKSLRTVQPNGPYMLGGFCNGALVAYEMARQLHAQGQVVDLLVLMEPSPVSYLRTLRETINRLGTALKFSQEKQLYIFLWLQHLYRYLQHLYRYGRFPSYRRLQSELDLKHENLKGGFIPALKALHELKQRQDTEKVEKHKQVQHHTLAKRDAVFPDPIFPSPDALYQDYPSIFHWVASVYTPSLYTGKSTFLFFKESNMYRYKAAWCSLAKTKDKEAEIHILTGTHDSCKTIHLHNMAQCLCQCICETQKVQLSQGT